MNVTRTALFKRSSLIVQTYFVSDDTLTRWQAPCKIHTAASGEKRAGILCFSGLRMTLTLRGCNVASVFIRSNTPRNLPYRPGFPVLANSIDTFLKWQYAGPQSHVEPPVLTS